MRNPESILKDLRRISVDNHRCFGCGQEHNCSIHGCAIIREAVKLIEGLQGALSDSEEARSALGRRLTQAQQQRDQLEQNLASAQADLTAALADMAPMVDSCRACGHETAALAVNADCDGDCRSCGAKCICFDCKDGSKFVWRGRVQADGT